jgi:hypothetical protein
LNLGEVTRIKITKAKQNSLYGETAGSQAAEQAGE